MKLHEEQKQIIWCVKRGLTNIEIGEELGYSHNTIKKKLQLIYKLFNVRGRIDLVNELLKFELKSKINIEINKT